MYSTETFSNNISFNSLSKLGCGILPGKQDSIGLAYLARLLYSYGCIAIAIMEQH